MPKPSDKRLRQYPSLMEIPADEWDEVFDKDGQDWTTKELEYLVTWIGRGARIVDRDENIVDLAYQLGRTPLSIHDTLRRMRADGWNVPYIRKERKNERKTTEGTMSSLTPSDNDGERDRRVIEKHNRTTREI